MTRTNRGAEGISGRVIFADFFLLGCSKKSFGKNSDSPAGLLENYWQWDHATAPGSTLPILVLDMYEHSYQMDYGAATGNYVDAFFRNIQWEVVASRLQKAFKVRAIFGAG